MAVDVKKAKGGIASVNDLVDEYAGCLSTGGELGRTVRGLRQEWDLSKGSAAR